MSVTAVRSPRGRVVSGSFGLGTDELVVVESPVVVVGDVETVQAEVPRPAATTPRTTSSLRMV